MASDDANTFTRPADPVGRVLFAVTAFVALAGGIGLVAMAALTTANVVTRAGFGTQIRGEFDVVNLGTGAVVFMFLPFCHLVRGNVVVDFFTDWAPRSVKTALNAAGSLIYLGLSAVLAWRMWLGGFEMHASRQQTAVLHIPYWWSFAMAVGCIVLLGLVCLYGFWRDVKGVEA